MVTEITDKYYLDVGVETVEISADTFNELSKKLDMAQHEYELSRGYFWDSHIIRIKR